MSCGPTCPVVRAQLREAVKQAPWLVEGKEGKGRPEVTKPTGKTRDDADKAVSTTRDPPKLDKRSQFGETSLGPVKFRKAGTSDAVTEVSQIVEKRSEATVAAPSIATASTWTAAGYQSRGVQGERFEDSSPFCSLGYFENVCTCSLECVVRALAAQGIIGSVALFGIGLKLCSELNYWYMPSRIS